MFSALGQDTIDALFWTATEPKPNGRRKREHLGVLAHFLLTIVYVILHTLLVLLQATTLNVAINASNKALLTIMMSNNVRPFVLVLFISMFWPQSVEYITSADALNFEVNTVLCYLKLCLLRNLIHQTL